MVAHNIAGGKFGPRFSWCDAPYRTYKSCAELPERLDDAAGRLRGCTHKFPGHVPDIEQTPPNDRGWILTAIGPSGVVHRSTSVQNNSGLPQGPAGTFRSNLS